VFGKQKDEVDSLEKEKKKDERFVEKITQIHLKVQEQLKMSQEKYNMRHEKYQVDHKFHM